MDIQEVRKLARQRFDGACRLCPVCDGRVCAGEVPGMGGLGTGSAFRNNVEALAEKRLNLRTIHDVCQPQLRCRVLGLDLTFPVLAAPIGGAAMNMKAALTEEEYTAAVIQGCRQAGVVGMTGDGPNPGIFAAGLAAFAAAPGLGIPVIKPRENDRIIELAETAARAGAPAFGIDIDAAALVNMTNAGQPVGPKTVADLRYINQHTSIPFVVKGIMTPDEAENCLEAGVDAIVVSNHGGRALDHTPGTAEVLPYIAEIVNRRLTIFVDGGVRNGVDVLKMLALGADAVLVGRPVTQGAVGGGADGVALVLNKLAAELRAAMVLTGVADVGDVPAEVLW
ncbi:MAG TPA: alpha-hydroxy-acid oxidizing protein [Patescibacteria group bacterium]|nr:alpha-hydroxy-acid oxidizing protein [Patescibacteria group bacterium]